MEKNKPLTVACIPAFNEERTIARVVLLAQRFVDTVVVCDDGSSDLTAEVAEGLGCGCGEEIEGGSFGQKLDPPNSCSIVIK